MSGNDLAAHSVSNHHPFFMELTHGPVSYTHLTLPTNREV